MLNNSVPKSDLLEKMDLSQIYTVAKAHSLTAITAYALESAGIKDERFRQEKAKAIRKNAAMNIEREKILSELEKAGIWYMPMKGIILQELYPKFGMRQMCDNDILFDKVQVDVIKSIMNSLGFDMEHDDSGHDLAFTKKPISNFELHTELFGIGHDEKMNYYYEDVKSRLLKDTNNKYGFHFSNDDFYIFMIAHEYKHFNLGGTGLRSLIDTYVYIKKYSSSLDWIYISCELKKLGIHDYENNSRKLAFDLFDDIQLCNEEKKLLDYYIFSGTYGNTENSINNNLKKYNGNKVKYVIDRIILPMEIVKKSYPIFYNNLLLLPLLPLYRLLRGIIRYKNRLFLELKQL